MNKKQTRLANEALRRAIVAAGGPKRLGEALKISGPAISQWKMCPPKRVPGVSDITGVPRHELRPDLYEAPVER
jgi:DNA-binding transcriptional regulator YdaS (Cro superfamily)